MIEFSIFLGADVWESEGGSSWSFGSGFWAILLIVGGMAIAGTGELLWKKLRFPMVSDGGHFRGWGPEWVFLLSRAMGGLGAISMFIGVVFAYIWFVD